MPAWTGAVEDGSRTGPPVVGTCRHFAVLDNRGPAEIRGNAERDLAALNKVEILPVTSGGA